MAEIHFDDAIRSPNAAPDSRATREPSNAVAAANGAGAHTLETLPTPCLVLERSRLTHNLDRFASITHGRGVSLRPHLKTAKSIDIARLVAPDPSSPIAVSTLLEAEYFSSRGYRDIFYTVGLGPGKLPRVAKVLRAGVRLITCLDDLATAERVAATVQAAGVSFQTAIEIDCGEHRGGISPESEELVPIAQALGASFIGIATHGGHSYAARSAEAVEAVARAEVEALAIAAARLAAAGFPSPFASVGSSPTALTDNSLAGVTEMRAGVYMFGDLFQAGIGTCTVDEIALTVLTEVIGHRKGADSFLVDAGAFALSKDVATAALPPREQAGFGLVCDLDGKVLPGLKIQRVWQEHGLVVSERPIAADTFRVGTRLRILPNHACPTAAAHSMYNVVDGGRTVLAQWPRLNGW